jgi:hypothetical protein
MYDARIGDVSPLERPSNQIKSNNQTQHGSGSPFCWLFSLAFTNYADRLLSLMTCLTIER